jgi:hypothetical protein
MNSRKDRLAAQKAQVALVFQKMLGTEEARAYLIENNFTESNIERILHGDPTCKRAGPAGTNRSVILRAQVTPQPSVLLSNKQRWLERSRRIADKM